MPKFKAIILDMDGVMIDSEPVWEKTESILLKTKGIEYHKDYREKIVGLNQTDSAKLIIKTFDLDITVSELINERIKILLELYEEELKIIDGLVEFLCYISEKQMLIGLASSSPRRVINYVLNKFSIDNFFSAVISGEDTTKGKPNPDLYLLASHNLMVKPEECIAIEDSINGVLSAKNAGMYCIAIPDKRLNPKKFNIADEIVSELHELVLVSQSIKNL